MKPSNRKLLIVDDASNWRTTLLTLLKPHGFEVTIASNVMEAFHALQADSFFAAILDVRLDDMDDSNHEGISTVLVGALGNNPDMSFIVLSSYYNEAEVKSQVPEGVNLMYFDKNNFRTDDLIKTLEQFAERKNG